MTEPSSSSVPSELDQSLLVSLIVVGTPGFEGLEQDLERLARSLKGRYAFFEILLIGVVETHSAHDLMECVSRSAPQTRLLQIEGVADFDRMAMHGYQECIGDIVVLSSADEIGEIDIGPVLRHLEAGEEIVRLRRRKGGAVERATSYAVRSVTGLHVDTRVLRTLGLNRQLLSELLARPDEIHLFRFTAHTLFARQSVIEVDAAPTRSGLALLLRRVDLVARLIALSAPRLLRISSALCLALSVIALLSLFYVIGVWLFREEIAEGWTTMISMLAIWMFAQLAATSALCLGLSRILDRQERARLPRLADELTISDLFSRTNLLNVESAHETHPGFDLASRASPRA